MTTEPCTQSFLRNRCSAGTPHLRCPLLFSFLFFFPFFFFFLSFWDSRARSYRVVKSFGGVERLILSRRDTYSSIPARFQHFRVPPRVVNAECSILIRRWYPRSCRKLGLWVVRTRRCKERTPASIPPHYGAPAGAPTRFLDVFIISNILERLYRSALPTSLLAAELGLKKSKSFSLHRFSYVYIMHSLEFSNRLSNTVHSYVI